MHEVRVYQSPHKGTLWWAEDDRGFTGGADTLDELLAFVREWAEAEGTVEELMVILVGPSAPQAPPVELQGPAPPTTVGVSAVRVESPLVPA